MAGLFRGLWAGLAGGMLLPKASWRAVAGVTAAGAFVGGVLSKYQLKTLAAWEILVATGIAVLVALALRWMVRRGWQNAAVALALACIIAGLAWQIGLLPSPFSAPLRERLRTVATEPTAERYDFDGEIFIKTMFLVKRGVPYFEAYGQAMTEHSGYNAPPSLKFNYREAWPARFVVLVPGNPGLAAWGTFLALVLVAIISAYWLCCPFVAPGAALLGPMLLVSYFSFPLTTKWFPLTELWAGCVAVLAITLFVRERWWAAALAVTLAVAVRELMVYLIPVGVLAWLVYPQRRKALLPVIALVALPVATMAYHLLAAPGALVSPAAGGVSSWLRAGPDTLSAALRFSAKYVPLGKKTMQVVPIIALLGAMQVSRLWRKTLLVSAVLVPMAALAVFSNGVYGYYWGGIAQPLLLAMVPLAFVFALPRTSGRHFQ